MKFNLEPSKKSETLNPVAHVSIKEVVELLEIGSDTKLSDAENTFVLPLIQALRDNTAETMTLLDVVNELSKYEQLKPFAKSCQRAFLPQGNYGHIFNNELGDQEA